MRTDSEQQAAWTPGPWCVYRHSEHVGAVWTGTDPEAHGRPLCEVHPRRGGTGTTDWLTGSAYMRLADARLVALAPEMAAAILEADDLHGMAGLPLGTLAGRLREIWADARQ